jgi:diadenosine tetraphosphate (Ap4A) HIT family hydrolase
VSGLVLAQETVIRRGAVWTMAVNRNQDLLGKTMIVLERPCSAVVDLHPSEWAGLHAELRQLVPALTRRFAPDQFNFAFLMNQDAQVHLHVIPRYRSQRTWQGRIFDDPDWGSAPGQEQRPLPLDVLAELAQEISAELRSGHHARLL